MKIGTDFSIKTCREEGYLTATFTKKDIWRKEGKNTYFLLGGLFTFEKCMPSYIDSNPFRSVIMRVVASAVTIEELYREHLEKMQDKDLFDREISEYRVLAMADELDSYFGLDYLIASEPIPSNDY